MKNEKQHVIKSVLNGSIADELGLEPNDIIININNNAIKDIFDYHYLVNDEYLEILVMKPNGEEWILEVEKDYDEDLGIVFEEGIMDEYRSCKNKCIFCFIDQMPKGMRETLYFKDDDSRLSFLQGNYITLTNMTDEDIDRIILYKLSPINISIHTMNKELRTKMLNNRFAGEAIDKIKKLYDSQIIMNGQIVLCKDVNDGQELEYSIMKMTKYLPYLQSVSIVPVGITKYRDDLFPLKEFTKDDARNLINIVHKWQNICYEKYNTYFIHASDEWYLLADEEIPDKEKYEGYLQLENGVGMLRLLKDEFFDYLKDLDGDDRNRNVTLATGVLMYEELKELTGILTKKFPNIQISIYPITNNFFGDKITVAGLLTGQDIIAQLRDKSLGEKLLLPSSLLKNGESVLLDDISIEDIEKALQVSIHIVQSDGQDLIDSIIR